MCQYIPFEEIQIIFQTKKAELEAILVSYPSPPKLVKTPLLLTIMTGKEWTQKKIISHHLCRIYIATLFYINSLDKKGILFDLVKETLLEEQQNIFETCGSNTFLKEYINAYERAIIKYLHLFKVGSDVSLAPNESGKPPITFFILQMTKETIQELEFHELLSKKVWDDASDSMLQDYMKHFVELQRQLQDVESRENVQDVKEDLQDVEKEVPKDGSRSDELCSQIQDLHL